MPSFEIAEVIPTLRRMSGGIRAGVSNQQSLAPFFKRVVVSPHNVVTAHLIGEAGQPTIAARDEILAFCARRLATKRPP